MRDSPTIVMGHGGGGQLSAELVEHLFVPAFGGQPGAGQTDSAVFELGGARLAFSTDSFVVRPLFFPGGSIGDLAVNGTVNDLAMSGAVPSHLSCGFILEEGTDLAVVGRIAQDMGAAARAAGRRRRHRRHEGGGRRPRRPGLREHGRHRADPRRRGHPSAAGARPATW